MLRKSMIGKQAMSLIGFVAILVTTPTLATLVEVALFQSGVSQPKIMLVSNAITGIAVAIAYMLYTRQELQRRQAVEENLQIIREMNHEVRSVLGIVAFYGKQANNDYVLKVFENGFKRMDSIMREVLSRGTSAQADVSRQQSSLPSTFHLWGELGRRYRSTNKSRPLAC